jgi:hypothetical protein
MRSKRSYYFGIGFEVQSGITSGDEAVASDAQTSRSAKLLPPVKYTTFPKQIS